MQRRPFAMPFNRTAAPGLNAGPMAAPPPPPVAVAPPPPPPPVVAAPAASADTYEPRDPAFYYRAACLFASALQPPTPHPADRDDAERSALVLAKALDRGIVPKGYVMPATAKLLMLIAEREQLGVGDTPRVGPASVMTEAERVRSLGRLALAEKAHGGPIPARSDALAANEKNLEALRDLSETVRDCALNATCFALSARPTVTGAASLQVDALNVLVLEIERANRIMGPGGLPLRSEENMTQEQIDTYGSLAIPYPASMAADITAGVAQGILGEVQDMLDGKRQSAPSEPDGVEHG